MPRSLKEKNTQGMGNLGRSEVFKGRDPSVLGGIVTEGGGKNILRCFRLKKKNEGTRKKKGEGENIKP